MNKKEFKEKAIQTIDGASAKINELKSKRESISDDVKSKYDEAINALESLVGKKKLCDGVFIDPQVTPEGKYTLLFPDKNDGWIEVYDTYLDEDAMIEQIKYLIKKGKKIELSFFSKSFKEKLNKLNILS